MFNATPKKVEVVAFVDIETANTSFHKKCNELCQKLLLNEDVKHVLYLKKLPNMTTGKVINYGRSFNLIKELNCKVHDRVQNSTYRNKIKRLELEGVCLTETIFDGQIDILLQSNLIMKRKERETSFGINNSLISVNRVNMWQRTPSGMEQVHRSTTARLDKITQPMILSKSTGGISNARILFGFERQRIALISGLEGQKGPRSFDQLVNAAINGVDDMDLETTESNKKYLSARKNDAKRLDEFMVERADFLEKSRDKIRDIANLDKKPSETERALLDTYISALIKSPENPRGNMAWHKSHKFTDSIDPQDKLLLQLILDNINISYSRSLGWISVHQASEAAQPKATESLFKRLSLSLTYEEGKKVSYDYSQDIYETLASLPVYAVKPHLPQIAIFAKNQNTYNNIYKLLPALHHYGENGVEILMDVFNQNIESRISAQSLNNNEMRVHESVTIKATLHALSRASDVGKLRLDEMIEGIKKVQSSKNRYHAINHLFINALVCNGATDEILISLFVTNDTSKGYNRSVKKSAKRIRNSEYGCGRKK